MLGRRAWGVVLLFLVMETSWSGTAHAHALVKSVDFNRSDEERRDQLINVARGLASKLKSMHGKNHQLRALEEDDDDDSDDKDPEAEMVKKLPDGDLKKFFTTLEEIEEEEEKQNKENMVKFIILVVVVICIMGAIAYSVQKSNQSDLTMKDFLLGDMTALSIGVGMMSGVVFGFIDNAGLFFGMEYLDPVLSNLPKGDEPLVLAGYGNTFSDMIGAFLGTFAGKIIEELAKKKDPNIGNYPIWTEAVGITIGCLIGVMIPRTISGDPDQKLYDESIEKAKRLGIEQKDIDELAKTFDELDKTMDTEREGYVRSSNLQTATRPGLDDIIREADNDGNGWVSRGEVMYSLLRDRIKKNRDKMREQVNGADPKSKEKSKETESDSQESSEQPSTEPQRRRQRRKPRINQDQTGPKATRRVEDNQDATQQIQEARETAKASRKQRKATRKRTATTNESQEDVVETGNTTNESEVGTTATRNPTEKTRRQENTGQENTGQQTTGQTVQKAQRRKPRRTQQSTQQSAASNPTSPE